MGEKTVWPPLRWPGGKRWLARALAPLVSDFTERHYFEPFLGGGALFFAASPAAAYLSDVNGGLIETYEVMRDAPDELERAIAALPLGRDAYYEIRAEAPANPLARAARFLYLNRAGFSGLHRLNKQGQFNVPFGGRSPEILIRRALIRNAARVLRRARLSTQDFEAAVSEAGLGDFVYCDPVYTRSKSTGSFGRYNVHEFSWADQERLAATAKRARDRGAIVLVSNVVDEDIQRLYYPFKPIELRRASCVAASGELRGSINELLFVLAPSACRGVRARVAAQIEHFSGGENAALFRAA